MSTFKVAGVSKCKGSFKVRFANDMTRVKILVKTGHSDIELLDLPNAMSKSEVVTYLKTTELYNNTEYRQAIDTADTKYNGVATVKVKAPKAKTAKPSLEAIKARAEAVAE
jgi:hypothetical protein